jgi:hypothetical protein
LSQQHKYLHFPARKAVKCELNSVQFGEKNCFMKRKYLYALALLLCLSTVAFSNERARFWCETSGNATCPTVSNETANTAIEPAPNNTENHVLLQTIIKLLYI